MDISSVYSSSALFFSKFSKLICKVFNSKYAGVSVINGTGGFDTISFCSPTQEYENFSFSLKKTSQNIVYYDDINQVFINKDIIKKYQLKSYMEIPLRDTNDIYIGDIVLFGDESLNPNILDTNILTFIVNRTSIEIEKKRVSDELIIAKNLLNQSPSCSCLVNKQGIIIRKIGAFYDRLLGYQIGDNIMKFDKKNEIKQVFDKVCFDNNNIIGEITITKENGDNYPAEIFAKEIGDSQGNSNGIMIILRDISDQITLKEMNTELQNKSELEQKRNLELMEARDQAVAATKIKSQFLATISHEIRTPLNGVIGMAEMLLKTSPLNTEQHDIAETIFGSGELLLSITSDILDFSKIEASRLELEMIEFDFIGCLEGIAKTIGVSINNKPIEIVTLFDPDIPHRLVGDPNRLVQIMLNMGTNAVKYTEKGHIIFKVSVLSRKHNWCKVKIGIEDSGIGIKEEQRKHLFEPFHQIDASTTRKYGGSGLGLAISSKLAKLMGGSVLLEKSTPGVGSLFSVTLEFEEIGPDTLSTIFPDKIFSQNKSVIIVDNYDVTRPLMEKKFSHLIGGNIYGVKEDVVKEFFGFIHNGKSDPNNPSSNIDFLDINPKIKHFFDPTLSAIIVCNRFMDDVDTSSKYVKEFLEYYPKKVIVALSINQCNFKLLPPKRDFLIIKKPISSTSLIKILNLINENSPNSPANPLLSPANGKRSTTPKKEKYDFNVSPMRIDLNISGSSPKLNIYSGSSDEDDSYSLNLANIELINDPISTTISEKDQERNNKINEIEKINQQNKKEKEKENLEKKQLIQDQKNSPQNQLQVKAKEKPRILLVDDNAVNRKVVKLQLKKLGYECDTATNGFEGFEKQKEFNYDLIFMDLNMPECDGSTASKLIRSWEETNNYVNRVSIVGLSATYLHGSKDYCKSMGMDDFVVKPIKLDPLGQLVKKYLDSHNLQSIPKDFI
ncbi:hypothetical protein DICPUDRAFT_51346 [Dictyostelium purpureum]|uniref:histidine kinase n=1 Tax=Dictyostelium purpureum TaxID=5786 RepID=F1A3A4_DICPU|nr:uncharacterized protein DICPUDRAFT_51346 [Dictyostelium purpureum]EGC29332.1 hypothetical protein DICPUDRAFT_51346 [Dictyostelium purpureum]|eukprot:XP_003294148.1 hypothetical protein DICPUDRAFT_51346 [Dictyostelium purpureum]